MKKYVMSLDQGTTSSRCIIFDSEGRPVASAQKEFRQIYPRAGWVEHDPMEIWGTQIGVAREAMETAGIKAEEIAALGVANQRETTIVWDKATGLPVYNAIVWQCRRTAEFCDELKAQGLEEIFRERTGLRIDPYFSATKLRWILEHVEGGRERAARGALLFGTVDSWLIWNLTGGRVHGTDRTNASRTMLFNIKELKWDERLLEILDIPAAMLPEVKPSSAVYGETEPGIFGGPILVGGAAGDQQAALFGQTCFGPGMAKNTYGTGGFLLMNTGKEPVVSQRGLLTTVACGGEGPADYALEGSIFVSGAVIQWLRDELRLVETSGESEELAREAGDNNGVYLVPAFVGLGAPYWDPYARGTIVGLTRGTNRNHIVRAALESMAYQTADVLKAMEEDAGISLKALKVDGGAAANDFLLQFQADITGVPVERPNCIETTALGAAYLAGLAAGHWKSRGQLEENWAMDRRFRRVMERKEAEALTSGWKRAVERSLGWAAPACHS
ncbi:MAG: glycerol kinase GlpK, partial [Bacillota bacterium]|nr:glycerol kinase GlpK [Bacillota bacterium]